MKLGVAAKPSFCSGIASLGGPVLEEMGDFHSRGACVNHDLLEIIVIISISLAGD